MRYWDSSAIVSLVVRQRGSRLARRLRTEEPSAVTWCLSDVEVRSGLCRLFRDGDLTSQSLQSSWNEVQTLLRQFALVSTLEAVKLRAIRLLGVHSLKAADALQLGAALAASEDLASGWEFVSFDSRLCDAARREGFSVLGL